MTPPGVETARLGTPTPPTSRTARRFLFVMIGLALLIRLGLGLAFPERLGMGNAATTLHEIAANLAAGNGFQAYGEPNTDAFPFYPVALAAFYFVFGPGWLAVTVFNLLVGALTAITVFDLTRRLFDVRTGLIASTLTTYYPYLMWHHIYLDETLLFVWLIAAVMWALFHFQAAPSWRRALLLGLVIGVAGMTRSTAFVFLPAALLYLLWATRRPGLLVLVALGSVILVLPWSARNHSVTGEFVLISTHGGWPLRAGNNEIAFEYLRRGLSTDYITLDRRLQPPDGLDQVEKNAWFMDEVRRFVVEHPVDALALIPLKAAIYWSPAPYPIEGSSRLRTEPLDYFDPATVERLAEATHAAPGLAHRLKYLIQMSSYTPLLVLGLWGLWAQRHTPRVAIPFALLFLSFTAIHAVSLPYTRTRVPLDPMLAVFAAATLMRFRQRRTASRGPAIDAHADVRDANT